MTRRASLPGAAELFRATARADASASTSPSGAGSAAVHRHPAAHLAMAAPGSHIAQARRTPSRREWHEEKITVYVSSDELLSLEHARLILRADHGIAVDRGRIVREAIAELLTDLEANGEDSLVVRRLQRR